MNKINKTLMVVRTFVGKTLGLRSAMMKVRYIYFGIIRPIMCYDAVVWWVKNEKRRLKNSDQGSEVSLSLYQRGYDHNTNSRNGYLAKTSTH